MVTLTLDLEPSPFSFDFEPYQPHVFDWTSRASPSVPHSLPPWRWLRVSLTLTASLPLKTLTIDLEPLRFPDYGDYGKLNPLLDLPCRFLTIDIETRKNSINKPVSSGSMSIDENEDKSSHEDMQSQFVEPSGSSKRPRSLRSKVWQFFTNIGVCDDGKTRATCNACGKKYVIGGKTHDDDDLFDEDSIVKTTSKGASNVVDVDNRHTR
ncbi:hypothetical protein HKD37_03G006965 [Glycine soja]